MSLFYLESFWYFLGCVPIPSLGHLGPPFIGQGGALGQPKGSRGVFGGKKPLPERVKETWQLLLHEGPSDVAINL